MSDTFYAGQTDYIEKLNALAVAIQVIIDSGYLPGTTWIAGSGAPDDVLGNDGNYYLDTDSPGAIYGPKALGAWPTGLPLGGTGGGGGGASVTVSDTPPSTPSSGDLWWKTTEGCLKIYYDDGDTSQWVDAMNGVEGPQGNPGTDGVDGSTILHGSGAPSGGTGADGDFYIDTATLTFYGPKTSGSWGSGTVLPGTNGTNGTNGLGVPSGGATDYALVKNSATDNDTSWQRRLKPSDTIQALDRVVPLTTDFGTSFGTGATFTDKSDRLQCLLTSATTSLRGILRTIPSAPYTLDVCMTVMGNPADADACFGGITVSDGTKHRVWYGGHIGISADNVVPRIQVASWNSPTSFSANVKNQAYNGASVELWFRITDSGTLRTFLYSLNGKDYVQMYQEASNTFVTPTVWGLIGYNNSTDSVQAKVIFHHWKESTSVLGDAT